MNEIKLEPGRLALRKPELGPLLIVTVERLAHGMFHPNHDGQTLCGLRAKDFLPVLRPGDVVPAGSLLMYALGEHNRMPANRESRPWEALTDYTFYPARHDGPVAMLRYGPEEERHDDA